MTRNYLFTVYLSYYLYSWRCHLVLKVTDWLALKIGLLNLVVLHKTTKTGENNDASIDKAKAHCTLAIELISIEGFRAKRAYIAFWTDFHFCRIELIFGRLTCFDVKTSFRNCFCWFALCFRDMQKKLSFPRASFGDLLPNEKQKKPLFR